MIKVRYADKEDIKKIWDGAGASPSMRVLVFEDESGIFGAGGVKIEDGFLVAFSNVYREGLPKMTIWRCAQKVMNMIRDRHQAVFSVCKSEDAARFLKRLGFEYFNTTEEGAVYVWQNWQ